MCNLPLPAARPVRSLALVVIALATGGGVNRSAAAVTTITFESLPGPDGKLNTADDVPIAAPGLASDLAPVITDQYAALGLTFRKSGFPGTNLVVDANYYASPPVLRHNVYVSLPLLGERPDTIYADFRVPVRTVSVEMLSFQPRYLSAYNAEGTLLATDYGRYQAVTVQASENIAWVKVWSDLVYDYDSTVIDNVSFTFIPEPATLAATTAVLILANRRLRSAI